MKCKKMFSGVFLICMAIFLVSCSGFPVRNFGITANHMAILKQYQKKGKKIKLNQFTGAKEDLAEIGCRAVGPVKVPEGTTYASYIGKAFMDELKLAELWDDNSKNVIDARLDLIDFSSAMTGGEWKITVTFSSKGKKLFTTSTVFKFESYWIADKACEAAANAFEPAVQQLITDVIKNPEFKKLFK